MPADIGVFAIGLFLCIFGIIFGFFTIIPGSIMIIIFFGKRFLDAIIDAHKIIYGIFAFISFVVLIWQIVDVFRYFRLINIIRF
jgi:hypothetical protein